jgi:hypothetical protein
VASAVLITAMTALLFSGLALTYNLTLTLLEIAAASRTDLAGGGLVKNYVCGIFASRAWFKNTQCSDE